MSDTPRITWSSTLYFDFTSNPINQALSDKVNLPTAILESLISQISENVQLPHPLIFRITNPTTGQWTHVGVREFTAEPDRIHLPLAVLINLQLVDNDSKNHNKNNNNDDDDKDGINTELVALNIQLVELPKGQRLQLRPLEPGYDSLVQDYKALLEHKLRAQYTALTEGDTLIIDSGVEILIQGQRERKLLRFKVDEVESRGDSDENGKDKDNNRVGAISIIDTDLDLEIIPLTEDQARQSLEQQNRISAQEVPIRNIVMDEAISIAAGSRSRKFRIKTWDVTQPIWFELVSVDSNNNNINSGLDIDSNPPSQIFIGVDEITLSEDSFLWSTVNGKQVVIAASSPYLDDSRVSELILLVSPSSDNGISSFEYILNVTQSKPETTNEPKSELGMVECANCHTMVPERSIQLHSNFCQRNNVACDQGCKRVFLRTDGGIPDSHWHCKECSSDGECIYGDTHASYATHQQYMHQPTSCRCGQSFSNYVMAAQHRALECPLSLHICQFCHLSVPRGTQNEDGGTATTPSSTSAMNIMVGFTDHEAECGNRTSDCHMCNKAVRLRDMKSHLKWHQMERLDQQEPLVCSNENCVRVLESSRVGASGNALNMCGICFGPLYSSLHDPDGTKLRSRLERRYVIQMTRGCGKTWCRNHEACLTAGQGLGYTKPTMGSVMTRVTQWISDHKYLFCVDEMTTKRHDIVSWIAQEGVYSEAWIAKAVQESKGNEDATRQWLSTYGVKISE